jgi:hypothetical protein
MEEIQITKEGNDLLRQSEVGLGMDATLSP